VTLKPGVFKVIQNGAVRQTIRLSIGPTVYSSIMYRFLSYLTLNNIVTFKSRLEATQGH